jgi:hypothetical protein
VIRKDRTTARGGYVFRDVTRVGFYRVKARAGRGYRASFSKPLQIYVVRAR